jgi:hypothetical protein
MQRLKTGDNTEADEDALLEYAIKLAAAEKEVLKAADAETEDTSKSLAVKHGDGCDLGYIATKTKDHFIIIIQDFFKTFMSGFISERYRSGGSLPPNPITISSTWILKSRVIGNTPLSAIISSSS